MTTPISRGSDKAPPATRWNRLFEKVGREASNMQHLVGCGGAHSQAREMVIAFPEH
jgi:hypothetical protein